MNRYAQTPRLIVTSLATLAVLAACRGTTPVVTAALPPPTLPTPSVRSEWLMAQSVVLDLIADNKPAAAESALLQFTRNFARTPEGDRARWWRTLIRAEVRATSGEATVALALLDSLLSDSIVTEVRAEAMLMRRSISAIDSLRRVEVRRRTQATQLAGERLDEIKTARDSLARLQTEIVRLRRRLRAVP